MIMINLNINVEEELLLCEEYRRWFLAEHFSQHRYWFPISMDR